MFAMSVGSRKAWLAALVAASVAGVALTSRSAQAQEKWGAGAEKSKAVGRYADVNGIHLYYEIHGSGRPVVLLHGGLGAIEMFGPNLPALAQGHQVIGVDLQGHGRTADIDRPLDPRFMADDIAALIKQLGIPKADIVGYSLGSAVALETAIRHPEVVNKVVAVSTVARRNAFYPEMLQQQVQITAEMAEQMKQTPMYEMYASLAPKKEDWPRLLRKIGEFMLQDLDYTREIATITAPVMFVQGDADIVPPSHAVELFGLLGGGKKDGGWDGSGRAKSRLAILPGLTHYSIFAAPELAATVIPFLDEGSTPNR
ncbi:MAG TPA: alpha/beta hydrolase [Gemmatimonadaceae bacterium]|nr:alpha/beta hydrolase [Gemmatimonadaceae bacterium]